VDADVESQTSNALDILRKIPLITVDGFDNIMLKGASNFKILVNGKESLLMSNNLKNVLFGMPASIIKTVEVFSNPPTKYSAEGIGGIINIVTTHPMAEGELGSINLRTDFHGGLGGSLYAAGKSGKLSYSLSFGSSYGEMKSTKNYSLFELSMRDYFRKHENSISNNGDQFSNFGSGELSYAVDSLNLIRFSLGGYCDKLKGDFYGHYFDYNSQDKITELTNTSSSKSNNRSFLGSIDYQRSFKKTNKILKVAYILDYKPSNSNSEMIQEWLTNDNPDVFIQYKNVDDSYNNSIQVDFTNPIAKNHQYELGARYCILSNQIENNITSNEDTRESKDLTYTHNMVSAYVDYRFNWERVLFKTGLRYEGIYTDSELSQETKNLEYDKNIRAVVPYLTMAYLLNKFSSLRLSYIQRLKQPDVWVNMPNSNQFGSYQVTQSNPNPKYEKEQRVDLTYNYCRDKAILEANVFAVKNNDIFQGYTSFYKEGLTYSYPSSGLYNSFGTSIYGSYSPNPKIYIGINGCASYSIIEANGINVNSYKKEAWAYFGSGSVQWLIRQGLVLSGFLAGYSKLMQLDRELKGYTYSSFSLRKDLLSKKMSLTVSVSNPFQKYRTWKDDKYDQGYYRLYTKSSIQVRTISFGISYRFGKMGAMVKKAQRGISNDDVKSGGGNSGGGGGGN